MSRHASRRGSLQYWPRSRAKRIYPRVKNYPAVSASGLLGFAGYKVGMTHVALIDNRAKSMTKGEELMAAATVVECPPLKIAAVRFYVNASIKHAYGRSAVSEVRNPKMDKDLGRKISLSKKPQKKLSDIAADKYDYIALLVYTQPAKSSKGQKTPELFEVALGGNKEAQLKFATENFEKEIPVSSVLKEGQLVDVHAVTTGKGFQGPVKRFGVMLKSHKSEKKKRAPGNLGPWHPAKISFRVPQAGQMGYHTRTDYNKQLLMISSDVSKINPKGGFVHYGNVQSEYVLVRGSIPGPASRLVRLCYAARPTKNQPAQAPKLEYVGLESKQ